MKVWMVRRGGALLPENEADQEAIMAIPEGRPVEVSFRRPRSLPMHRFYWAVLTQVVKHMPERTPSGLFFAWSRPEDLHDALKATLGYVRPIIMPDGSVKYTLASTSFDRMDQIEFAKYFERAMDVISTQVLGYDVNVLIKQMDTRRYRFEVDVDGVRVEVEPRRRDRFRVVRQTGGECDLTGIVGDDFRSVEQIRCAITSRCTSKRKESDDVGSDRSA